MGEILRPRGAGPAVHWTQVAIALSVLAAGTLVYVLDRPAVAAPFFSAISLSPLLPTVFGGLGDNLPTFAHAFAFSLLTAAYLGGGRRVGLMASLAWYGGDSAFEVGQYPEIAQQLVRYIPGWFERLPILEQADAYFVSGTFDAWDLISIAAGATAAYLITMFATPKDLNHG